MFSFAGRSIGLVARPAKASPPWPIVLLSVALTAAAFGAGIAAGTVLKDAKPEAAAVETAPRVVPASEATSAPVAVQPTPLPTVAPVQPAAQPPAPSQTYTVLPGENLTQIAQRFGTTPDVLIALNNLTSPNRIVPGQVLFLPR